MGRYHNAVILPVSCEEAFSIVHDYQQRLAWDTLLRSADLLAGATAAGLGVRTRCVGCWRNGFIAMETEYITFKPGRRAAVRLTNQPLLFSHFAATIAHEPIDDTHSKMHYIFSFRSRPRWLSAFFDPILAVLFQRETAKRLKALQIYLTRRNAGKSV